MTVSTATGPADGPNLVAKALSDLGKAARYRFALLPGQPQVAQPLPIYTLKPDALSNPAPLSASALVGWRYLVKARGDEQIIDLSVTADGASRFYSLRAPEFARQFTEACAIAEKVTQNQCNYAARIIKIPSLHVDAVWLAAEGADIFVRIPIEAGQGFRREAGHHSGLKPATVPT